MKFFDLEAHADRFARFRRYPPQNSKIPKSEMSDPNQKNIDVTKNTNVTNIWKLIILRFFEV